MILGDNERFMLKCEVTINSHPKDAPNISLLSCIPILMQRFKENNVLYEVNNGRAGVAITGIEDDDEFVKFLFHYANKDASDPAFSDLKKGKTRVEKKKEGEGLSCTSHLIIKKTPRDKLLPNSYEAILEEVPSVTRTLLSNALTSLLNIDSFRFDRKRKNGGKNLKCRPIIIIDLLAASTLEQSLSIGYLCGLTAVRSYTQKTLDANGVISIDEEMIKMSCNARQGKGAMAAIKTAYDELRGRHYGTLRISLKDQNKRTTTENIKIDKAMTLAELAVAQLAKREKALLATPIATCQTSFHAELIEKMKKYMLK
ncbi:hypothetical protein KKI90_22855 [Xenorhabdus bovienii]|uniref:hypothetical protein n=1 Tax=Xenorhabdus bovienii TaxID=40576 RepID=UPI00237D0300|nr:hypothetical protein [Xenorhabdus bovienii]MDE1489064.1 hypothetical protein [Xenorhabdus bovienii]MDE9473758.1 hypothetical protein [Xenorhabdus bovienii]MDE9479948.1 hypothetical protein [Xenorhabdus bovienii]MDE9532884.1 hypothetical protein [Xenorhabdus bovienii]